jgi:hypothetical protein
LKAWTQNQYGWYGHLHQAGYLHCAYPSPAIINQHTK